MPDIADTGAAEAVTETQAAPAPAPADAEKAARIAARRAAREAARLAEEGPPREAFVATADIQLGEEVARRGTPVLLTAAHAAELKAFIRPAGKTDLALGPPPVRFG